MEHRVITKKVNAEVVQVKDTRHIKVFHCLVTESRFAQHCGMFSHAGVAVYQKFRETVQIEAQACREAQRTNTISLNGQTFNITIGVKNQLHMFVAGSLDAKFNCKGGDDGRVIQSDYEAIFREEDAVLHKVTKVLTIPTAGRAEIQARIQDASVMDYEEGTYVWKNHDISCPETIVQLYHGPLTVRTNDSNTLLGGLGIFENKVQSQVNFVGFKLTLKFLFSFSNSVGFY